MDDLRILIVEDELLLAMDLEQILVDAGHIVVGIASNTGQALQLADISQPQLAFVDINLTDGPTGIDIARSLAERNTIAVVFMTANVARIPEDYAGAIGAIGKPYSSDGVLSALSYLSEGILHPPPTIKTPSCLRLSTSYAERWR